MHPTVIRLYLEHNWAPFGFFSKKKKIAEIRPIYTLSVGIDSSLTGEKILFKHYRGIYTFQIKLLETYNPDQTARNSSKCEVFHLFDDW